MGLSDILDSYIYLDLEVDLKGQIFSYGLLSSADTFQASQEQAQDIHSQLLHAIQTQGTLCGHNFRRFDQVHLTRQWPELEPLQIIDTLELSLLAFALEPSHRLQKDYKLSDYASNDPLEDVRATRLLLEACLNRLDQHPAILRQLYTWLLTHGQTTADAAYRSLFEPLGWLPEAPPALSDLPPAVLTNLSSDALDYIWGILLREADFDRRFIIAALLVWNFERNQHQSKQAPSAWLNHLPQFQDTLDQLFPVTPAGFTYQPFLEAFDIPGFRGVQEEAVQAIIARQNPLILMPTGGGKSLCYQLPALMYYRCQWGLTVCISPLQALMEDQVVDLEAQGLDFATFINGNLPAAMRAERLDALRNGQKGLLYISPEQLRSISIRNLLRERPPALWVIDEAHCVSQWGQDFRPDYRYIPKFIHDLYTALGRPLPALALLTATATAQVRDDICQLFQQQSLPVRCKIAAGIQRDNLNYQVLPVNGNKDPLIVEAVQRALDQGGCALVYTALRRDAERLATMLQRHDIQAHHYHGKVPKAKKSELLNAFKNGDLNVVTATCAFGMGINRKDVRVVVHNTPSGSLEGYIQEAGRAGRDGAPADCMLLFDPQDLEMLFFLKSLNHLSRTDLRNIFTALRGVRDRIRSRSGPITEDWFWVTTNEIYQTSDLDDRFATDDDQRETKMRVALHHLEDFGLIERAENLSTVVQFHLKQTTPAQSWDMFLTYSRQKSLKQGEIKSFERLIYGMHLVQQQHQQEGERVSLERLSDESGIPVLELPDRIRELQRAEVCTSQLPLTLLVTKAVKGDAKLTYGRYCTLEDQLLSYLADNVGDKPSHVVNPRKLATFLDADGSQKLRDTKLTTLLEGWQALGWVSLKRLSGGLMQISAPNADSGPLSQVIDWLPRHQQFCTKLLDALYAEIDNTLETKTGARLVVQCDFEALLETVCERPIPTEIEAQQLRRTLIWLHEREIVRLTDGLTLFHQALKVRVFKGANLKTIYSRYPTLEEHYKEQARKTHLMAKYGELAEDDQARQQLVDDYFTLTREGFTAAYPGLSQRPVTQADYDAIMGPLNASQKAIVEAESAAISVIAGPGSGKTRTIVHRIAYLIKVKRVAPDRIVVLAYNRNAVRELRLRLQDLIGNLASRLRVYTFHGLALALLGRTLEEHKRQDAEKRFDNLLKDACDLLESQEDDDDNIQLRRIRLLGNTEHIFVDEYQDVTEQEYRLIRLISGLDDTASQDQPVQINLCVIGDDDQNIYGFRGADAKFIRQFKTEYQAKQFLLTENYRSTESIIAVGNRVIQNNRYRCKQTPEEQVCIDSARIGQAGEPVKARLFATLTAQAIWVTKQVRQWLDQGTLPNEIVILAKEWDQLNEIRALLERLAGIPTYALKGRDVKLIRHSVTHQLLKQLQANPTLTLTETESVRQRFQTFFERKGRSLTEPTVKTLLKIADDLDKERGFGSADLATPITTEEIATSIYEFSESPNNSLTDEDAILVTSCHGAKGLEFSKVILLTDKFSEAEHQIEDERRLFYVAITRAREELILCSTRSVQFLKETLIEPKIERMDSVVLPDRIHYFDFFPSRPRGIGDINLGYSETRKRQNIIEKMREGDVLNLRCNRYHNGWSILTKDLIEIGSLSKNCNKLLMDKGLDPNQFHFDSGEVQVRFIYRFVKTAEDSDEILEDHYVVIPQIRIYR
ncbi:RecQ family ATP-dependent DNA helicase [Nodosilinea sp. LEGE 07088]|uniref:RecQ family ATP-dependent DNA helicase n=1 Tax=Nodosilinea sp. LEGE 07088 TaxID=2777968 RepID=UPI001880A863|nr:RecQ family ATP-dependent DNA helicase [Nodosilinea sp. LEGE 07088]MBE9140520.1 RecQ family ATP-dependent DNA helicase [Nodosilinea sp. LEGE 07088]